MGISTTMYSPITSAPEHWSTFIYRSVESLAVVGLCQKSYCGNYAPWVVPLLHPSPDLIWAFYRGCSVGLLPFLALTIFPFLIRWTHFLPSLSESILTQGFGFVNPLFYFFSRAVAQGGSWCLSAAHPVGSSCSLGTIIV